MDRLLESNAFVDFSYGFTVFSILAPVIAGVGILFYVLAMFASNWIATKKYEERRFKENAGISECCCTFPRKPLIPTGCAAGEVAAAHPGDGPVVHAVDAPLRALDRPDSPPRTRTRS